MYLCEQAHARLFVDSPELAETVAGGDTRVFVGESCGFNLIPESQINKAGRPDLNPEQ